MLKTALMLAALAAPLPADSRFTVRQMTRDDVPSGTGQCDIRLRVDDEVEVRVGGMEVMVRERSGAPARDEGSECNYPLPRNPRNLRFEVKDKDGDGDIRLVQQPGSGGPRAIVYIRDRDGGAHRYHFRFKWDLDGSGGGNWGGGGGWDNNDDWGGSGGSWNNPGGDVGRAVSLCQDEIRSRLEGRYGGRLDFRGRPNIDSQNRNRVDVDGRAVYRDGSGRRGRIEYNCRVNVRNGRVIQADYRVEDRGNAPW